MTNLSRIALTFIALVVFSSLASAQSTIPAEKKAVLTELLSILKVEEQVLKVTDSMLEMMEMSFPALIRNSIDKMSGMTTKEKADMERSLIEKNRIFSKKIRERFAQKINYKEFIEETYYPLYDKFFTESEIRDMVNFYKTSTGQKVIDTMPELFAEASKLSADKLTPQIIKLVNEVIQEETESLAPPAPRRKKN